jgi:hypothetical protein
MGGNTPKNKRKSSSLESEKVTIRVEDQDPDENPIVVAFPRGLPEALQEGGSRSVPPSFVWQKSNEKTAFGRRIIGHDQHCVYSAESKGFGYDERRTKLCVGVYDKKRGVLTLREAASKGTIYSLEQSVPSYLDANEVVESQVGNNIVEYSTAVFEAFGSAKRRKVLKSQAANQVDIDHVVGAGAGSAVVDKIIKGELMSESNRKAIEQAKDGSAEASNAVERSYEEARRQFLPRYDREAKKPHLVYSAKKIAGENAWERLNREVEACMRKDDVATAILSGAQENDFCDCATALIKEIIPDSAAAKHRYTCALLMNWMLSFYQRNNFRKFIQPPDETRGRWFGMPMEIAARCLLSFTTQIADERGKTGYAMSKANKDKCVIHIILLYMMAQGEAMKIRNLKPLASDLKVTVNESAQMLRLAGCTLGKAGQVMTAALTVPLVFPKPKRGGARGR